MKSKCLIFLCSCLSIYFSSVGQNLSSIIESSLGESLYVKFKGKLFVKQTGENSLLLFCKSGDGQASFYDKVFVIFSETKILIPSFNERDIYEIMVPENKKFAAVYNSSQQKLHFIGLADPLVNQRIATIKGTNLLRTSITNSDYQGYGMSYLTGRWDAAMINANQYRFAFNILDFSDLNNPHLARALPSLADEGDSYKYCKQGSCTSGGAGSTSCKISRGFPVDQSCDVSCTSGYYACCDDNVVRCYCCKISPAQ